jgi:PAS domain S-box-containing protein
MKKSNHELSSEDTSSLRDQVTGLQNELEIQRRVAYAAGLFQGDVTIRTMLESVAEGVIIIDSTGTIVLINHQTERMFGYTKEEIVGKPLNNIIPTRYHNIHEANVADYFRHPRIRPMGLGKELRAVHKDRTEFSVEISLSHLETTNDRLAMAFVTDISLRKKAEESLRLRNEELDAYAHTVAHDLKGALTPIVGYCELLTDRDSLENDQQIQTALNGICRVSNKMVNIIDELLLLSSVRKDDVPVMTVEMKPIVLSVIARLKEEFGELELEFSVDDKLPNASGYAPWIEQVWYNYISNAIKYGGRPPIIEVGGGILGENVHYWVKDNGSGISNNNVPDLFKPQKPIEGGLSSHGLGLSIVKRIVEKLNGTVGVESQKGNGSKFIFTLPKTH